MKIELVTKKPEHVSTRPSPILFIHGAWHGAWCWEENFLPYFAQKGYDSHALSLRGHQGSENQGSLRWTRISDYVKDVERVVDGLAETPVLVGHSMGGLVVQKFLESRSAPAAVLMASVPVSGVLRTTLGIALRHPLAFLKANLTLSLYPIIGTPRLAREAFFSEDTPEGDLHRHFERMQDESYMAFLDMMFLDLPDPTKIATPILITGAQKDTIFTPKEMKRTARAYNTTFEIFPDMAHDMMLERGWQSAADRIIEWLSEKGL